MLTITNTETQPEQSLCQVKATEMAEPECRVLAKSHFYNGLTSHLSFNQQLQNERINTADQ